MRRHASTTKRAGLWAAALVWIAGVSAAGGDTFREWRSYLGDPGRHHYSSLDQITAENVSRLEVAWVYRSGVAAETQCNPIVVDGLLYGVSPARHIFALNAATGKEVWTFVPPHETATRSVLRGVQYWESDEDRRIIAVMGHHVYALDAATGVFVEDFGEGGSLDLKAFYDRDVTDLYVTSTSPGAIHRDTLIVSVRVSEAPPAAPGDIMAFDLRTGERRWVFHTIPRPGEFGYDTWPPEAWKTAGGANCWAGMTLDEDRGIVYVPTGSPAYDFYGADRAGTNLFSNCLIALKADTGERVWHFQMVRHDLWDRDLPSPPNLVTVEHDGKKRDAVAQITKSGYVFLFDRDTGEPLFPIEERPVPASDIPGEAAWPTQPVPLLPPPFARQSFPEELATDRTPEAREQVIERLRRTRKSSPFEPPSLEGTLIFPGFDGGGEWGGAAVNPNTGMLYVNANEMPWILTLFDTGGSGDLGGSVGKSIYSQSCAYCHGVDLQGDALGTFPPLRDLTSRYTHAQLVDIVRLGKERMPAFGHLKPEELEAVVKYMVEADPTTSAPRHADEALDPVVASTGPRFVSTGYHRFVDPDGFPAIKPPWGTLTAIDLNRGAIVWQVPLGETSERGENGAPTGTENYGGPLLTATGLIFIAASKDAHLRAFDERTGKELWKAKLPAGGYATPCTYAIDGRQYVVIAACGGKMGTPAGDAYVAFALPPDE